MKVIDVLNRLRQVSYLVEKKYYTLAATKSLETSDAKRIYEDKLNLYKIIQEEKRLYQSLTVQDIDTLLLELNNHPELVQGRVRCERKLSERRKLITKDPDMITVYDGHSFDDIIMSLLEMEIHNKTGALIEGTWANNPKDEKFKNELLKKHSIESTLYPKDHDFLEDQFVKNDFDYLPKLDLSWIESTTGIDLTEFQDNWLYRIEDCIDHLKDHPYKTNTNHDQFVFDTYNNLRLLTKINVMANLLDDEHRKTADNYFKSNKPSSYLISANLAKTLGYDSKRPNNR